VNDRSLTLYSIGPSSHHATFRMPLR
jgi:hypothetical protein